MVLFLALQINSLQLSGPLDCGEETGPTSGLRTTGYQAQKASPGQVGLCYGSLVHLRVYRPVALCS